MWVVIGKINVLTSYIGVVGCREEKCASFLPRCGLVSGGECVSLLPRCGWVSGEEMC